MAGYVRHLEGELGGRGVAGQLLWMTSSGGVVPSSRARREAPVRLIESGPAAGAVAAAEYARLAGEDSVLSFDMGGTTAKLCLIPNGEPTVGTDLEVARHQRFAKGSGLSPEDPVDSDDRDRGGRRLDRGAEPARPPRRRPAQRRRRAGPGRLRARRHRADGDGRRHPARLCRGRSPSSAASSGRPGGRRDGDGAARGRARHHASSAAPTASTTSSTRSMAKAASMHAADCGADPRALPMVAFGGAGPVHAYGVARKLGVRKVICPVGAGVTSAVGLLIAPVAVDLSASAPMAVAALGLRAPCGGARHARRAGPGGGARRRRSRRRPCLSPTASTCAMSARATRSRSRCRASTCPRTPSWPSSWSNFFRLYRDLYGRTVHGSDVEAITWRLRTSGPKGQVSRPKVERRASGRCAQGPPPGLLRGAAPVGRDARLRPLRARRRTSRSQGPAIVEQTESTVVVGPRAVAHVDAQSNLVMQIS